MSQRLPAVRARQLIRVLEKEGWQLARVTGSHHLYKHPGNPNVISVPKHRRDLKRGSSPISSTMQELAGRSS